LKPDRRDQLAQKLPALKIFLIDFSRSQILHSYRHDLASKKGANLHKLQESKKVYKTSRKLHCRLVPRTFNPALDLSTSDFAYKTSAF
jgi:hypothetical protein